MTEARQTIKATFLIWLGAVVVAVAWPSFAHPGRAYTIWSIGLLAGLPCLSLVVTALRFRTLNAGMRILGLLPPALLVVWLLLRATR